ncbi:MAG: hypothetical protein ACRDSZ_24845 [Pseudonocardiaceae bacterium]
MSRGSRRSTNRPSRSRRAIHGFNASQKYCTWSITKPDRDKVRRITGRKSTKNAVSLVTTIGGPDSATFSAQAPAGVRPSVSCTWP